MNKLKLIGFYILASFFVFTGVMHLLRPEIFVKIIPPLLPWPYALAILSGVAELVLAIGLLPQRTRRLSAWGLIALLIAVFPANIYMYVVRESAFPDIPAWALLLRLPLQLVLIAWVYAYTRTASSSARSAA